MWPPPRAAATDGRPPVPGFQRGLHAPHLCGPYRQPSPTAGPPGAKPPPDAAAAAADAPVRVYCDLDGVLADFNRGCLELFPEGGPIAEKIPTHTVTKLTWEEEGEMWRRVEQKTNFFLSLPWTPDGEQLWQWIDWNCVPSPAILTGLPMGRAGQMASKQKEHWCHRKLGDHVAVFCCGTRNKQKFSGANCVLVDDRGDLREAWEARGGIFIHHTSASESIRQLREVLRARRPRGTDYPEAGGEAGDAAPRPMQLTSVCWAAQTPAGCFRPNCRYLHVPISKRHRSWIQMWGFVWWNQRMFDDMEELVSCVRAVYAPEHEAAFDPRSDEQMDEQSSGAFRRMFETLLESCDLGMPFEFLGAPRGPGALPPVGRQIRSVIKLVQGAVASAPALGGADVRVVVAGSMGLGVDVEGSDLDLVLCCSVEQEPIGALRALMAALSELATATALIEHAAAPVLTFRLAGVSVDVTVNQMGSVRDALLFRYALRGESPDLAAMLRLLKDWLKRREIPAFKQGGFPSLVWLRMAVRFYQEHSREGGRRVARDWLRRFLIWASRGLPTGGSPLTIHGEQAESSSNNLCAGVPAATLLFFVFEMFAFLEGDAAAQSDECSAGAEPHSAVCRTGAWEDQLALFYVQGEALRSEVILCRVEGVIGGPLAELRRCTCSECWGDSVEPMSFVSRRSREWLALARREDLRKLRVQATLKNAGIEKNFAGAEGDPVPAAQPLPLQPRQLVGMIGATADPVRQLSRMQDILAGLDWLAPADPISACLGRRVFLAARSHTLAVAAGDVRWAALAAEDVYARAPERRPLEEMRAADNAAARLRRARSVKVLSRALKQELPFLAGSEALREAEQRLATLLAAKQSSEASQVPPDAPASEGPSESSSEPEDGEAWPKGADTQEPVSGPAPKESEREDATVFAEAGLAPPAAEPVHVKALDVSEWLLVELPEGSGAVVTSGRARLPDGDEGAPKSAEVRIGATDPEGKGVADEAGSRPARPSEGAEEGAEEAPEGDWAGGPEALGPGGACGACGDGLVEVSLSREAPGDILGFTCEADGGEPQLLRIISVSQCGLLGRYNRSAAPERRVGEGSLLVAVNGKRGDVATLRCELAEAHVQLSAAPDRARPADEWGRWFPGLGAAPGPGFQVPAGVPRCRCTSHCKCGLIDAVGKAGEAWRGRRAAWAALAISNLAPDTDEEALYRFFSMAGPVVTVKVVRDTRTWQSQLHGFANFQTFQDAQRALRTLDGRVLRGRRCHLSWSTRAFDTGPDGQTPREVRATASGKRSQDGGPPLEGTSSPPASALALELGCGAPGPEEPRGRGPVAGGPPEGERDCGAWSGYRRGRALEAPGERRRTAGGGGVDDARAWGGYRRVRAAEPWQDPGGDAVEGQWTSWQPSGWSSWPPSALAGAAAGAMAGRGQARRAHGRGRAF